MNILADTRILETLSLRQRGVFSKADLQAALADPHPAGFVRRVRTLVDEGVLRRFTRGFYVTPDFDLATLSQRIAPESYVSFGTVLARELIIGTSPDRQVIAVKVGRNRTYSSSGFLIEHVGVRKNLYFGFRRIDGVAFADPEKAALDTLYFHQRGRRYPFDIYSDINIGKLDPVRVAEYLKRYRNPKFVAFAANTLGAR